MPASSRSPHAVVTAVAERRSRSARLRRRRRQSLLWLLVAALAGSVAFGAGLLAAPLDYSFQPVAPQAVLLLDSHGRVFATLRSPQTQEPVSSAQIPQVVKNAFVAAEDERFFDHSGVDPLAAVRALWRDVTGAKLQGGSTITQQYVKNVYTGSQRTALRKLREASLAIRLEQHLSKDQILTRYLNTLYLGNGTAGVQAASRYYFGVPVTDIALDARTGKRSDVLALARAATLAGMAPAPSVWNPVHDPREARARELYVLNQMVRNRLVTSLQASDAYGDALPRIVAAAQPDAPTIAPEFRDLVNQRLQNTFGADYDTEMFGSGGVKVTTTLDLDLQKAVVQALHSVLPKKSDPEAAVVAIDPRNGDIRALTQKIDGGYVKNGYDLARPRVATRSSGSTIKPFTLAVALEQGHRLNEVHYAPECVRKPYHLCNAETGSTYQTLRSALIDSINTVYGPLAVKVGLQRVVDLAQAAGMQIDQLDRSCDGLCPAQALGIPVTPLSEAVAFGTLVDHGVRHDARSITGVDSTLDGNLYTATKSPAGQRVMPARIADAVTGVMQGVVDEGTGRAARQPFPVYGKTGTTDDEKNAWFTGCTRTLCLTVWMGYDKQRPMTNVEGVGKVYGGTLPAKIFAESLANYRELQATHVVSVSPTPNPVASGRFARRSSAPQTPSFSPAPRPTRSRTPSAPASRPASPPPSTSPPPTLLPSPP